MNDNSDLLPCPFCGGRAEYNNKADHGEYAGGHFVQCTNSVCMASSLLIFACGEDPLPKLMEKWNRRIKP